MVFAHQACTTIVLVTLTLGLQSAGVVALIQRARAHLPSGIHRLSPWRSGVLMVRLTTLIAACTRWRLCCGLFFIACIAFQPGNLLSTFPQRVILPSAMEILFSGGHGASWVRQKALQVFSCADSP